MVVDGIERFTERGFVAETTRSVCKQQSGLEDFLARYPCGSAAVRITTLWTATL
jgi:hypothetical protein